MAQQNRISYAWWLNGWDFEARDVATLTENGEAIPPEDYALEMKGSIFCPGCFTPLFRSPAEGAHFANRRVARYNHYASFAHIECGLRSPKAEALKFATEELAQQAIENGKLTVVHEFRSAAPEAEGNLGAAGGIAFHEDVDGPVSAYPVSRYKGESFALPTKISSVASICRRFDRNLFKYYVFPGRANALMLSAELTDIRTVVQPDETPRLYFAEIVRTEKMGKSDQNLRMTYFACHANVHDFCMKATIAEQSEKGIDENVVRRFILIWGVVTESGIGLCINRPKWGEYALLPAQYERLLPR
ncbi:hypothetical protein [Massilia brevitalea]|uniref:hypothetical protein n=1 Tax=Massilia brevitalea TaxID=442526 RepID=UPI002738BB01|nr:hypothetical protein [Massilia brevitalea]